MSEPTMVCLMSSKIIHYSDVIMSAMTSQITGVLNFPQSFVQVQIKENNKGPPHFDDVTMYLPYQSDCMIAVKQP